MRKSYVTLTAGIAAMMLAVTGCSSQAPKTDSSLAETQADTTEAETTVSATEKPEETTKEGNEQKAGEEILPSENSDSQVEMEVPVKIWGTIIEVTDSNIRVDNQSTNSSTGEIILTIDPENTKILDGVDGFPVDLEDIELGSFEAYLGPAMTMSLPPQTTPFVVFVNIPEDQKAPEYVIAADSIKEEEGEKVLAGKDGKEYTLLEEVSISPFLTKQMVRLEDIEDGSECLIWTDEEEKVEKIVLFNQ